MDYISKYSQRFQVRILNLRLTNKNHKKSLLINHKGYHKNETCSGYCFEFQYEVLFYIFLLQSLVSLIDIVISRQVLQSHFLC